MNWVTDQNLGQSVCGTQPGKVQGGDNAVLARPEPETSQSERPPGNTSCLQELRGHGSKTGVLDDLQRQNFAAAPEESACVRRTHV